MRYLKIFFIISICIISGCQMDSGNFSIDYEKFTLDNGLEVILHEDHSDPIVAVATVMHVGSNREKPGRTGFAHFFEHMSFNDSENVPRGANRKMIPEWGGIRNGGTWNDGTIYYEVVPKDAFDKILWIDSDRFGYMIKTVTEEALEREKQVVKNEKRERVDNAPYGFTNEIIIKNLYPLGHPYSWTVIGELEDLQSAELTDVMEFYEAYYGANNASLVIAGDIDIVKTKAKVLQWFGEIRKGPNVQPLGPMPVNLDASKSLYFEDNFAKLPELRMVFPTVENYHPDVQALNVLSKLLENSKKAPFYRVIVQEKRLAPAVSSYQSSKELAGEFVIRVRANANVDLDSVKKAIDEAFELFEKQGFDDKELQKIKAESETNLYRGIETILDKAYTLVNDNEYAGDPSYVVKRADLINKVTREDVMHVYNKYIKGKSYVMTSFVPYGQTSLIVEGAQKAEVFQEQIVANIENEEVSQGIEAVYDKTPSIFDRSEPELGELPLFKMPDIWVENLPNSGIQIYGIENNEIPLITFDITLNGGHFLERIEKSGASVLLADLMMEGTAFKTPIELEEEIGLLGASVNVYSGNEEIRISATCLAKNFNATADLVSEILLHPRWDQSEYDRLRQKRITQLKGNLSNPTNIAYRNLNKLLYGPEHVYSISANGTLETLETLTIGDLESYYEKNISPDLATLHVAGAIGRNQVIKAFDYLDKNWKMNERSAIEQTNIIQKADHKLYFIDVPGAKQSVIFVGKQVLSASDPLFNQLSYSNEILGGGSSGRLFQTLRIEKGYTYGAYSFIVESNEVSPFIAYSSVRANATSSSLEIIESLIKNYSRSFTEEEVAITKNKLIKSNAGSYESLSDKLSLLRKMSKYKKSSNYLEEDQDELINMTLIDFKSVIDQYLVEDEMVYVVVGDKESQLSELDKMNKGMAIELDKYGNRIN
ncbi:MAG: peptidase M16 [Flammeovirgaceae bacterium]|nr:peptidase M16 [Flammeovirgaceae bacterium]